MPLSASSSKGSRNLKNELDLPPNKAGPSGFSQLDLKTPHLWKLAHSSQDPAQKGYPP